MTETRVVIAGRRRFIGHDIAYHIIRLSGRHIYRYSWGATLAAARRQRYGASAIIFHHACASQPFKRWPPFIFQRVPSYLLSAMRLAIESLLNFA